MWQRTRVERIVSRPGEALGGFLFGLVASCHGQQSLCWRGRVVVHASGGRLRTLGTRMRKRFGLTVPTQSLRAARLHDAPKHHKRRFTVRKRHMPRCPIPICGLRVEIKPMSCGNGREWRRWRNQGAIMGRERRVEDELKRRFAHLSKARSKEPAKFGTTTSFAKSVVGQVNQHRG